MTRIGIIGGSGLDEPPVEWAGVLRIFEMNVDNVNKLLLAAIRAMP